MTDLADPRHAWFVLAGVLFGLLLAAGGAAWITVLVARVIREAREVIAEMRSVVAQARGIAYHVSSEYRPLKDKVDRLERLVEDIRKIDGGSE